MFLSPPFFSAARKSLALLVIFCSLPVMAQTTALGGSTPGELLRQTARRAGWAVGANTLRTFTTSSDRNQNAELSSPGSYNLIIY